MAQTRSWRVLLHYEGSKSEVISPEFFFSPQGAIDPEAELRATWKAMHTPANTKVGTFEQHPQCAYPERFRFLRESLGFKGHIIHCPEFLNWKRHLNASSVTLVYAAPYLGHVASTFGHTFLKLNSGGNDLLNYGVSFEAVTEPRPNLTYVIRGLIGRYSGIFSQSPYHEKIRTYLHLENRELWQYDLALGPEQVDRLVNHLWEMQSTQFRYYFINGNCSYQILSLLEVASPDWRLREKFRWSAIPLETLREVSAQPGAVARVEGRPPLSRQIFARYSRLSKNERQDFRRLQNEPKLMGHESAAVLDTALDWRKGKGEPMEPSWLLARAKAGLGPTITLPHLSTVRPDRSHKPLKISLTGNSRQGHKELGLTFRTLVHDALDPDAGYVAFSSLVLGAADLRYLHRSRDWAVDKLVLADVVNMSPLSALNRKASWRVATQLYRPGDLGCMNCLTGQFRVGSGASFLLASDRWLIYSLLNIQAEELRFGPSLEVGSILKIYDRTKFRLTGERWFYWPWDFDAHREFSKFSATLAWAFVPLELRVGAEVYALANRSIAESQVALGWYF